MAFISMVFVFLAIVAFALCVISFIGFIILLISVIKLRKNRKQGVKPKKAGIVIGSALFFLPAAIVSFLVMCGLFSNAKLKIQRLGYKNLTDKWKMEWISDSEARNDVVTDFIKAADEGDKEKIMSMFTDNIQKDEKLSTQTDEFLKEYPKGLYGLEFEKHGGGSGGSYSEKITFSASAEVVKDGETYYLHFGGCSNSKENKEEVGLEYFYINSEKAEVLEDDITVDYYGNEVNESTDYISAKINVDGDYTTRRISAYPYKYYEKDRKLTKADAVAAVKKSRKVSDLEEILGEPNSNNVRLQRVVYELEPENDEPRYMVVGYDYYEIISQNLVYIAGTEDTCEWEEP
jgi:hypothetical protein